jgi:hypothetical protein
MPENFGNENESEPKIFSAEEVEKIQSLIAKVREVVEWDLGSRASEIEELDLIRAAKDAVSDFETVFDMPKTRFWATPEREEHRSRPVTAKTISQEVMAKLQGDLHAIREVIEWDIDPGDREGLTMIQEAREALTTLADIF